MIAFRTQVMAVMTALLVATALVLGTVLMSAWTGMMIRRIEDVARGLTNVLAAQLDQQHELIERLLGPPPPLPPTAEASSAPAPSLPPPALDPPGKAPGSGFKESLLELAEITRAQQIALVAKDGVMMSVTPKTGSRGDVSEADLLTLRTRLGDGPAGTTEVLQTDASVAVMTILKSPGPNGERPALLVQLPKTLPRDVVIANARILALITLVVVALAVAAAWYLSRNVSKPLSRLAATARAYGRGSLDEPAPVTGPAETRHLGLVLNSMATSLQEHIRDLQRETSLREHLESEMRIAAQLQRSLLPPPELQQFGPVEVLGWSQAAESVGGDFYDFRLVSPGRLAFLIGDATGKGLPAALLAARCLSVLQALIDAQAQPDELFRRVNSHLWEQFRGQGRFVTAFIGVLDVPERRFVHACAGHNRPYLARAGESSPQALINNDGLPLAVREGATFDCVLRDIWAGDTLLLYTDGVTETPDAEGHLYGDEHLQEVFGNHAQEPLPQLLTALTEDIRAHSGHWPPGDDCTLLLLRFN